MRTPSATPVVVGVNGTSAGLAAVRLGAREAVARGREARASCTRSPGRTPRLGRATAGVRAGPPRGRARSSTRRSPRPSGPPRACASTGPAARRPAGPGAAAAEPDRGTADPRRRRPGRPARACRSTRCCCRPCPGPSARSWWPAARARRPVRCSPRSTARRARMLALRLAAAEAARRHGRRSRSCTWSRPGAARGGRAAAAGRGGGRGARAARRPRAAARSATRPAPWSAPPARPGWCWSARAAVDGAALLGPVAQELLRRGACPTLFVHGTTAAAASLGGYGAIGGGAGH